LNVDPFDYKKDYKISLLDLGETPPPMDIPQPDLVAIGMTADEWRKFGHLLLVALMLALVLLLVFNAILKLLGLITGAKKKSRAHLH
jgi:hypothetical protein